MGGHVWQHLLLDMVVYLPVVERVWSVCEAERMQDGASRRDHAVSSGGGAETCIQMYAVASGQYGTKGWGMEHTHMYAVAIHRQRLLCIPLSAPTLPGAPLSAQPPPPRHPP